MGETLEAILEAATDGSIMPDGLPLMGAVRKDWADVTYPAMESYRLGGEKLLGGMGKYVGPVPVHNARNPDNPSRIPSTRR